LGLLINTDRKEATIIVRHFVHFNCNLFLFIRYSSLIFFSPNTPVQKKKGEFVSKWNDSWKNESGSNSSREEADAIHNVQYILYSAHSRNGLAPLFFKGICIWLEMY
jgi:hypothetical protein